MHAVRPLYRVLFVCAGNTCRSPIAEAVLRQALGAGARARIESVGVQAFEGAPASPHAITAAAVAGLDLSSHQARRATAERLNDADLVLALDESALAAARRIAPAIASRSHLIGAYAAEGADADDASVPDPFGGSREAYEECVHRIRRHAERIAPEIARELRARGEAEAASTDKGGA